MKQSSRRDILKSFLLTGSAMVAAPAITFSTTSSKEKSNKLKGNINHSVCRWTYNFISLDELCVSGSKEDRLQCD